MSLLNRLFGRAPTKPEPTAPLPPVPAAPLFERPPPSADAFPDLPPSPAAPVYAERVAPAAAAPPARYVLNASPEPDDILAILAASGTQNLTGARFPADPTRARAQLRQLLDRPALQVLTLADGGGAPAAVIAVRDAPEGRVLVHFAFTEAALADGLAPLLWHRLGRPPLPAEPEPGPRAPHVTLPGGLAFDSAYVRGARDLRPLAASLALVAGTIHADLAAQRHGKPVPLQHTQFARYALEGIDPAAIEAFAPLGFLVEDFAGAIATVPGEGTALWVLNLANDAQSNLFRHRSTGALVPAKPTLARAAADDEESARAYLKEAFENEGPIGEDAFLANVRLMLARAPAKARILLVQSPPLAGWLETLRGEDRRIELVPAEQPLLAAVAG